MSRKRSVETAVEAEECIHSKVAKSNFKVSVNDIQTIISNDESKSLQSLIECGQISNIDMSISELTKKSLLMEACEAASVECQGSY